MAAALLPHNFTRTILTAIFIRINRRRGEPLRLSGDRGLSQLGEHQGAAAMKRAEANGVELAFEEFGPASHEVILLIAGLGTQMLRWTDPFCLELAGRGYRVIRFDNRDAGCSTHISHRAPPDFGALAATLLAGRTPDVPYTLDDMAADTVGLLDALSIDRAHVVGRSMGGMIAQVMACEHSERVASLTSIMSSTGNPALPPPAPDAMAMMTRPAPDPVSDEAGYLAHSLAFARRLAGGRYPFDEAAKRRLILEEVRRAHDRGGFGRQMAAIAVSGDRRARLATVTAPTLVIHGTDDPLFLPACGEDTAASIPQARFMLMEGMGHDLPPELHGTVAQAIDQIASRRL
jgi:pimeloyl-ACP methyl ester carboxylesterase